MNNNLIIIGVNGFLGRGITEYFLEQNYDKIYLCDRKDIDFPNESERLSFIKTQDLTSEENVSQLFDKIKLHSEERYFLYSTVGGFMSGKLMDTDYEKFKFIFGINLYAQFLIGKHFYSYASKSAGGSICFTSAYTAFKEEENKSAYGTSKAALNYLVKTMALEGNSHNLTANAIAPFALDSAENREWIENKVNLISPSKIAEKANEIFQTHPEINGKIIRMPENVA